MKYASRDGKGQLNTEGKLVASSDDLQECCCGGVAADCTCKYSFDGLTNYFYQSEMYFEDIFCPQPSPCCVRDSANPAQTYYSTFDRLRRASLFSSSDEFTFDPITLSNTTTPGRHRAVIAENKLSWLNCSSEVNPDGNPIVDLNHDCAAIISGSRSFGNWKLLDPPDVEGTYVPYAIAMAKNNLTPPQLNSCFLFPPENPSLCVRGKNFCETDVPEYCPDFPGNCFRLTVRGGNTSRIMWGRTLGALATIFGSPFCDRKVFGSGKYTSDPPDKLFSNFPPAWPAFEGKALMAFNLDCDGTFTWSGATCNWQIGGFPWAMYDKSQVMGGVAPYNVWSVDPSGFSFTTTMVISYNVNGALFISGTEFSLTFTGEWFTF